MAQRCVPYGSVVGVPRGLFVPTPAGVQAPITGGAQRKIVTKDGVTVTRQLAGDGLVHDFTFTVKNPSSRLRLVVEAYARSNSVTAGSFTGVTPVNVTWQLRAASVDERDGGIWPLQLIYGPVAFPDGYEVDSGVRLVQGTIFIPANASFFGISTPNGTPATVTVQASWEPNEQPISDDELQQLLAGCALNIDGQPVAGVTT